MALPTVTTIRLGPKGPIRVGAELRLSGDSFIACHTYTDHPPILQVEDEHVSVSISPGDPCTSRRMTWRRRTGSPMPWPPTSPNWKPMSPRPARVLRVWRREDGGAARFHLRAAPCLFPG
jgi:hypothetical protein